MILRLKKISPDPNQPRKSFDAQSIQALADDIKTHGLISPIIVRTDGVGRYVIVAGERRWRAFQLLKEPTIKAIIRDTYRADNLGYIQVAENLRREDLKFYELAEFIIARKEAGVQQSTLADELGMNKSEISRYMDWKDAPEALKSNKDKFGSIKAFSDLCALYKTHEEEVENFVSENDRISAGSVRAFKKQLEKPDVIEEAIQSEELSSQEAVTEWNTSEQEESIAGEAADAFNGDEIKSEDSLSALDDNSSEDVTSGGDSNDTTEAGDGFGDEQGSSDSSFDSSFAEQTEGSSESSEDGFNSFENESGADTEEATEEAADELLSDSGDEKLKKPLIIGTVDGREGYLQYKKRPTAEGMIWVKWEDGFEEEILAEKFRINRITEE